MSDEFTIHLEASVREVLAALCDRVGANPRKATHVLQFQVDGDRRWIVEEAPSFEAYLDSRTEALASASSIPLLLVSAETDDRLARKVLGDHHGLPTDVEAKRANLEERIWLFARNYFEIDGTLAWDHARYEIINSHFDAFIDSATTPVLATVVLEHLNCSERLTFSDAVTLRPFTAADKTRLWRSAAHGFEGSFVMSAFELSFWNAALEVRFDLTPGGAIDLHSPATTAASEVISTLRLHRLLAVGSTVTFVQPARPTFENWFSIGTWRPLTRVLRGTPTYELATAEHDEVKELYDRLLTLRQQANESTRRRIDTALHRFDLTFERATEADRLVDLWIALEALLLPEDSREELGYRLRLRAGRYLSSEPTQRKLIAQRLSNSYAQRSAVVHGRKLDTDKVQEAVASAEVIFRDVMLQATELGRFEIENIEFD